MSELFIELFSEEIPARMQKQAGENLKKLLCETLAQLNPSNGKIYFTPRRLAVSLHVNSFIPPYTLRERGPRLNAPEKALEGFLRKHQASASALEREQGFWILNKALPEIPAAEFIGQNLPQLLWNFPWPKSQRWGNASQFSWVRPLHRIVCILDNQIVPFSLKTANDTAHGLEAHNISEGHRFLSPTPFQVTSAQQWEKQLIEQYVIADPAQRQNTIKANLAALTHKAKLKLVEDQELLDEVTGLVEWPIVLLGHIDSKFMDLPAEVMQVSMRLNQKYFALRHLDGTPANQFAFIANIIPENDGELIIKGNERVLKARFADAEYFWNHDRKISLEARNKQLRHMVFHAQLGTQADRVLRLEKIAEYLANYLNYNVSLAKRAAFLCKADLTSGMVGEFPELQGIMGGYYAQHDHESPEVCRAIAEHYKPSGLNDTLPEGPISIVTALSDKIDLLTTFFAIGEKPKGSGDPYALRRAALGIIRIIRENGLRLDLNKSFQFAISLLNESLQATITANDLTQFIYERLYVQLRKEGARYDILSALSPSKKLSDLVLMLNKVFLINNFINKTEGKDLLATVKRSNNILQIENKKDGPHIGTPDPLLLIENAEKKLFSLLKETKETIKQALQTEDFDKAMNSLARLKLPLNTFFDETIINDKNVQLRKNRLKLLNQIHEVSTLIADFNQIEK